jgi:hypothetical protein
MNRIRFTLFLLSLLIPFAQPMADEGDNGRKARPIGALMLPLAGRALDASGRDVIFSGTVTINRFVGHNHELMAVGIARGTITVAGQVVRSGLQDVALPVTNIGQKPVSLAIPPSGEARLVPVSFSEGMSGRFILAQASCGILHLDIGGNSLDLLGFMVKLSPITLDISGDSAGPLGSLACQIVGLLGTVANVVGLLNNLLGVVTGLVGGLTGGL